MGNVHAVAEIANVNRTISSQLSSFAVFFAEAPITFVSGAITACWN
jgi:hypothetical protein